MKNKKHLLGTTSLDGVIPAIPQPYLDVYEGCGDLYTTGVWHDLARTIPCRPGMTIAVMELSGKNGPIYAEQPDPNRRPTYMEKRHG